LLLDLFLSEKHRSINFWLVQLTLVFAAVITLSINDGATHLAFAGTYVADPMGSLLKVFIYLVTGLTFLYSRHYLVQRDLYRGEFYVLGLFAMLGMMVMVSAHSMLTIYLGLELLSLSLYAMVAFNRDSPTCSEAAMKYFVLGALASGMLLYGMSILYGITGSLDIAGVARGLTQEGPVNIAEIFALVFVVTGLAFKLGAVPFHMWIPDVYQGAPTPVTLFIGSAAKIAAFGMTMRLLVEATGGLHAEWHQILVILSVLSLALGNVAAVAQTNLKRMLAYSTISHVGFFLLGILSGSHEGYAAAMFYIITYSLMAAGAFGMIILLSRAGFEADEINDFKGLSKTVSTAGGHKHRPAVAGSGRCVLLGDRSFLLYSYHQGDVFRQGRRRAAAGAGVWPALWPVGQWPGDSAAGAVPGRPDGIVQPGYQLTPYQPRSL
jgi:NADH-quinone oxidoreductase subunit N